MRRMLILRNYFLRARFSHPSGEFKTTMLLTLNFLFENIILELTIILSIFRVKKYMFNAVKNARIVGILLILFGLFDFLGGIKTLTDFLNRGNAIIAEDVPSFIALVAGPVIAIVAGFGLIKSKLWAVYGIGLLALVRIITLLWASSEVAITTGNFVVVGIYILLFIWFYSSKKDFSK